MTFGRVEISPRNEPAQWCCTVLHAPTPVSMLSTPGAVEALLLVPSSGSGSGSPIFVLDLADPDLLPVPMCAGSVASCIAHSYTLSSYM